MTSDPSWIERSSINLSPTHSPFISKIHLWNILFLTNLVWWHGADVKQWSMGFVLFWICIQIGWYLMRSQALWYTQNESKVVNNGKVRNLGHVPWLSALWRGRGACWSSKMELRRMKSNIFTHLNLHQTNQQVGQYIVGTPLVLGRVMGDLGLTRLTTAQTRGKPPPSPNIIFSAPLYEAYIQMVFCLMIPQGESWNCQGLNSCNFAGL
jgi:hypothetical protein